MSITKMTPKCQNGNSNRIIEYALMQRFMSCGTNLFLRGQHASVVSIRGANTPARDLVLPIMKFYDNKLDTKVEIGKITQMTKLTLFKQNTYNTLIE